MNFEVASFWSGSDLSYFEHLCMKSFVDNGYKFHLFTKGTVKNIPDYVEHHNADEIYEQSDIQSTDMRYSNGIYSDIWRIHLLQKTDFMWVDLDVYCLRRIDYEKTHYFGINYKKGTVNNCVLKLPRHSVALHLVRNFLEARVPVPFWWRKPRLDPLLERISQGDLPTLNSLPWTTTGPNVMTWALRATGEINNGQHFSRYWHFESALNHEYLDPNSDFEFEAKPVRLIHLFGSTKLHLRDAYQGVPPAGSYMQKICDRHNISPEIAPIPNYQADPLLTNETKIPA